jgi:hypothetical protein
MLKQIVQNIFFDKTKGSVHFAYRTYNSSTPNLTTPLAVPSGAASSQIEEIRASITIFLKLILNSLILTSL